MDNKQNEIVYTIALTQLSSVGNITAQKLIQACGNAETVFKTSSKQLLEMGFSAILSEQITATKAIALEIAYHEMEFLEKNDIHVFLFNDDTFPKRLAQCVDAPILLYGKGNLDLNPKRSVAIVGTRRFTDYGNRITRKIIEEIASYGNIQIISGLAAGIDTIAHQEALQNSLSTIGVLGHGLQTLYPANNRKLAKNMLEQGGLITELTSTTIGESFNFPRRNRIIAGMSDAIIVVEAQEKGGALITAKYGISYGKEVFAVPGRIGDKTSEGCNNLIKYNHTSLILSGHDIVNTMSWNDKSQGTPQKTHPKQMKLLLNLNKDEEVIVNSLQEKNESNIDELLFATGLSISVLSTTLLTMEFKGLICCLPGKRYILAV
jgi:DNA processing protein